MPDLVGVRNLFLHLPFEAFKSLLEKEVDFLIRHNINGLQSPSKRGLGNDKVGRLSALRILFGTGWVTGGHYEAQVSVFHLLQLL